VPITSWDLGTVFSCHFHRHWPMTQRTERETRHSHLENAEPRLGSECGVQFQAFRFSFITNATASAGTNPMVALLGMQPRVRNSIDNAMPSLQHPSPCMPIKSPTFLNKMCRRECIPNSDLIAVPRDGGGTSIAEQSDLDPC